MTGDRCIRCDHRWSWHRRVLGNEPGHETEFGWCGCPVYVTAQPVSEEPDTLPPSFRAREGGWYCVCGASRRAHNPETLACPTRWRPGNLEEAVRQLDSAETSEARFTARGEVQRLLGHRPGTCTPLCQACDRLLANSGPSESELRAIYGDR